MDGWTEEGSRKESREEGRVVSSPIGYTRLTPKHPSPPREGDGSAGWRCREEKQAVLS